MLTLRPYQEAARAAVYRHLRQRDDHPCVVLPTGGGKSPLIAAIAADAVLRWGGRVLVLAHVKELLEQTADKLRAVCPELEFGLFSAGLGRRDTRQPVIVAGIQSVYRRACELDPFDLVMIDEAHRISAEGEGMYRQFLADAKRINPNLRIIGFTATPYRLKSGPLCGPDGVLNHVCHEVGVRELIRDGYLCPLVTKAGGDAADFSQLPVRAGEFVADEVESMMDQDALVRSACAEIVARAADRQACLIFACGVRHARHLVDVLKREHHIDCGFVRGASRPEERAATLRAFREGDLKFLCNVNVLTTGFDAPRIDCVALVRPTLSPGLYYQMVGRGFRLHPGKRNCLVLDFGGNVLRHGPVDQVQVLARDRVPGQAPAKKCPECQALIAAGYAACPECGHAFPPPERGGHAPQASEAGILSDQCVAERFVVRDVVYSVHARRDADDDAPKSLRVAYRLGLKHWQSEFICVEHQGYARQKAEAWWRQRSTDPVPSTAEAACALAEAGALRLARAITVRAVPGQRFPRIVAHELGPWPEPVWSASEGLREIPF